MNSVSVSTVKIDNILQLRRGVGPFAFVLTIKKLIFLLTIPGDIIAVLGKGDEEYQDIKGRFIFHSDKKIVMEMQ